ncbi:MAG: hypothetical protein QM783_05310 [Phycisphaerales bacterium]
MALVGTAVRPDFRRALTIIEVLVALFFLGLVAVFVALPAMARPRCCGGRQMKDGTQVRNVIQAMTIFAQGNRDTYPLPSQLDVNNQTVALGTPGDASTQRGKDTLNHILSILVFNSSISPELLYCPSEVNAAIKVDTDYQNSDPKTAVVPANAVWDPALRCDFTAGEGNISYAALMPNGDPSGKPGTSQGRLPRWSNTFNATEAVFGNRGPLVTGRDAKGNVLYNTKSLTMLIHGGRTTWEGNIGYNDNHVNFETRMDPTEITYNVALGNGKTKVKEDIFFYDEPDDADGLNAYLGVWIQAGNKPGEFKGIHD